MGKFTKLTALVLGSTALTLVTAASASAGGTAAGTNVQNTFTLDYQVGGAVQPTIDTGPGGSDTPTEFTVDRLINLTVASDGDTTVAPGSTDQELVFSLQNTGNDTQGYTFALINEAGDEFDASGLDITYYFDDGTAGFGPGDLAGTAYTYTPGSGDLSESVGPDTLVWVVVSGDIAAAQTDGDTSAISLVADTAEAGTAGTPATLVTADAGGNTLTGAAENVLADDTGTASAGDADNDGAHSATGTYIVASADLVAAKTVTIFSQDGTGCATIPGTPAAGDQYAVPGACVEYVISATNNGTTAAANATDIDLTDILPDDLEFIAAVRSPEFTGGSFSAPATNTDCVSGACTVSLTNASLAFGETGTVTIRALVK